VFGAREVGVELPEWMMGSWQATDAIQIPINGMFVMCLTILITIVVAYVLFLSRWGRQVRAVVQNRVMAGAVGINTEKVDRYTFGLGCGIAAVPPSRVRVAVPKRAGFSASFSHWNRTILLFRF